MVGLDLTIRAAANAENCGTIPIDCAPTDGRIKPYRIHTSRKRLGSDQFPVMAALVAAISGMSPPLACRHSRAYSP